MMTARMRPFDALRCAFETTTGAATTRFCVNTAAAEAGTSLDNSARSSAPFFFSPHAVAAKRNPRESAAAEGAWFMAEVSAGRAERSQKRPPIFHRVEGGFGLEGSWFVLPFLEILFEFCDGGTNAFLRRPAGDGLPGMGFLDRNSYEEIVAEQRQKLLDVRHGKPSPGLPLLVGLGKHLAHNVVSLAEGHARADQIVGGL